MACSPPHFIRRRWDSPYGPVRRKLLTSNPLREPNPWLASSDFFRRKKSEEVGFPFGPVRPQATSLRIHSASQTLGSLPPIFFGGKNRRKWDSNPRNTFVFTRFPSVLHRPLGHSSKKLLGDKANSLLIK